MNGIWAGVLLVCYLAATSVLLVATGRVAGSGLILHLALLTIVSVTTFHPVIPRWLRQWAPLLALLFLYSEMPLLIAAAGHDVLRDSTVIAWEQALLGGQPAREWAARWRSRVASEVLHGAYLSYYAIIFVVPAVLHVRGRTRELAQGIFAVMLTFIVCFVAYLAFPVAGPRYVWPPADASEGVLRSFTVWLLEARSSRGTAFPSSHVAVSATQSVLAIRYFGRHGLWLAGLSLLLSLGAIYGGYHYAVDVLAGAVLGIGIALATLWMTPYSQAKASAPT